MGIFLMLYEVSVSGRYRTEVEARHLYLYTLMSGLAI